MTDFPGNAASRAMRASVSTVTCVRGNLFFCPREVIAVASSDRVEGLPAPAAPTTTCAIALCGVSAFSASFWTRSKKISAASATPFFWTFDAPAVNSARIVPSKPTSSARVFVPPPSMPTTTRFC